MPLCIRPARVGCLPSAARMITAVDYTRTSGVFFFFWVAILPFFLSLLYVRASCVSRHPVSYIFSACLVSYCLLVRQQQRFHHPTLRTSVVLVGCIKKSNITSKHDHCCILVHVRKKSYIVPGKCVPGVILSSPATTTAL